MPVRRPRKSKSVEDSLDPGIKSAVLALRAAGIATFESCDGNRGHTFPEPTIRFNGDKPEGFKALAIALAHGFNVYNLRRVWRIEDGEPTAAFWELTFFPKP